MIKLNIVSINDKIEYNCKLDEKIELIINKCGPLVGITQTKDVLCIYYGRILNPLHILNEYNITNGSTLLFLHRNRKPLFDPSAISGMLTQLQLKQDSIALKELKEMGFKPLRAEVKHK